MLEFTTCTSNRTLSLDFRSFILTDIILEEKTTSSLIITGVIYIINEYIYKPYPEKRGLKRMYRLI